MPCQARAPGVSATGSGPPAGDGRRTKAGMTTVSTGTAGTLHIDLHAVAANYRTLAGQIGSARCGAVVKADAYGLGAVPVARALAEAGCRHFFVAHLCEGLEVRPALPDDASVFVMHGLNPGDEPACAAQAIVPVLNSLDQVDRWAAQARAQNRPLPAALQADTGMSRLGLSAEELDVLDKEPHRLGGLSVILVMSHLACADVPADFFTQTQLARFDAFAARFPGAARSIDNSGGTYVTRPDHGDIARPGMALYGGEVREGVPTLARVATLNARIIQLRTVEAGTGVGYGLTHRTAKTTRLATISAGYADGWPRSLSSRGAVFIGGVEAPILGRVSMDSTIVDVSDVPEDALYPGAPVELIGPNQSAERVAELAGTLSYEIFTRLGHRYTRVYTNEQA